MTQEVYMELETFFQNATLPHKARTRVGVIHNVEKFVRSHLSICKANIGNETFRPYFERLWKMKTTLEKNAKKA